MNNEKREQLLRDGYCKFEGVLPENLLAELRRVTDTLVDARTQEHLSLNRSPGSMINVMEHPIFADLIALPSALEAMASIGYPNPKFSSGYVISKPPKSPRLFWHYDWACWDDPNAFGAHPQQVFFMYYLVDTTRHNGCLRVLPGTHVNEHPLHQRLVEAHSDALLRAKDLARPEFSDCEDEVEVCVKAGDLLVGDSRILHASHANESDIRRTVITLWFHPDMAQLDEGTQGFAAGLVGEVPQDWPAEKRALIEPLLARYEGDVEPLTWSRHRPGASWERATERKAPPARYI